MSFPTVTKILEEQNLTVNTANEEQLKSALMEALPQDLPSGYYQLKEWIEDFQKSSENRKIYEGDAMSEAGKQMGRFFAPSVVKQALEEHFGVSLDFYNCHFVVIGNTPQDAHTSLAEQISLQKPEKIHC